MISNTLTWLLGHVFVISVLIFFRLELLPKLVEQRRRVTPVYSPLRSLAFSIFPMLYWRVISIIEGLRPVWYLRWFSVHIVYGCLCFFFFFFFGSWNRIHGVVSQRTNIIKQNSSVHDLLIHGNGYTVLGLCGPTQRGKSFSPLFLSGIESRTSKLRCGSLSCCPTTSFLPHAILPGLPGADLSVWSHFTGLSLALALSALALTR